MPGTPAQPKYAAAARIAGVVAFAALAVALPVSAAAAPTTSPASTLAAKPDGPIESSLSVGATGIAVAAGTVFIVRRHQRRQRGRR
ncbi:hypothetical protein [Streptomyces sp. NPDC058953]|uniref:hypothetical protein n=1 Tax=unclassified Streptomyces TaxID=2593676 RepID=UPI003675E9AC